MTFAANLSPLSVDSPGWSGYNIRQRVAAAGLPGLTSGSIRLTFEASAGAGGLAVSHVRIGKEDATPFEFASAPVEVLFGGASGFTLAQGASAVSDWIDFPIVAGDNIIITAYVLGSPDAFRGGAAATNGDLEYKAGVDETATLSVSGYSGSGTMKNMLAAFNLGKVEIWAQVFNGAGPWGGLGGVVCRNRLDNVANYNGLVEVEFLGTTDGHSGIWIDCFIGDTDGSNNVEFPSAPLRVTVAGANSWTVNPGDTLYSDPFPFDFSGQPVTLSGYYGGDGSNEIVSYVNNGQNYLSNSGEATASNTGSYPVWFNSARLTIGKIRTNEGVPPPPDTKVTISEARVFSIFKRPSAGESVSSLRVFSIYRFPAQNEQISSLTTINVVKRDSPIEVSEVRTLAVVKGRIANPKVRAWTFTLDGHDFYVLRLGDKETLVYDTASKQWVQWDSPTSGAWRPNIGTAWIGAQKLAFTYGSDIVAGDDSFGLLWFLDPRQPWDDATDVTLPTQQVAFTRIVTGQVLASARQQVPCYVVFLSGDNYGLVADDFSPFVRLDTSDDQGRTFDQHDTLTVNMDSNDQPDSWYSLGQFGSPGRIFRITDNGVYQRIDALDMNDDAG